MRILVKQILAVFVGLMIWAVFAYSNAAEKEVAMKISVKSNGKTTVFELNNSPTARDLYSQLPAEPRSAWGWETGKSVQQHIGCPRF